MLLLPLVLNQLVSSFLFLFGDKVCSSANNLISCKYGLSRCGGRSWSIWPIKKHCVHYSERLPFRRAELNPVGGSELEVQGGLRKT